MSAALVALGACASIAASVIYAVVSRTNHRISSHAAWSMIGLISIGIADVCVIVRADALLIAIMAATVVATTSSVALIRRVSPSWRGTTLDDGVSALAVTLIALSASAMTTGYQPDFVTSCLAIVAMATLFSGFANFRLVRFLASRDLAEAAALFMTSAARTSAWVALTIHSATQVSAFRYLGISLLVLATISLAGFFLRRVQVGHRAIPRQMAQPRPGRSPIIFAIVAAVTTLGGIYLDPLSGAPLTLLLACIGVFGLVARQTVTMAEHVHLTGVAREQEEYYRSLVQHSNDVIMICEPQTGETTYVSPAADHILAPADTLQGRPLHDIIGSPPEHTLAMIERLMAGGPSERLDGYADGRVLEAVASNWKSRVLVTIRDVSERERLRDELHSLAYIDPLTGLSNRHNVLSQIRSRLQTANHRVALLFIDLDRFKQVNDAAGHETGDRVLVEVAARLRRVVDTDAELGRIGGDEFVAVLDRNSSNPEVVAHAICEEMARPFTVHGKAYQLGASVGIAIPTGPVAPSEILRQADVAMYAAKRGRVSAVVYDEGLTAATIVGVDNDAAVARALRNNSFELHFQPVINISSGAVERVEALLRWRDATGKLRRPQQLLDFATRTGQMNRLTTWVLESSLTAMQDAHPDVSVSVNMPPSDLLNPLLADNLEHLLQRCSISPHRLVLEITEDETISTAHRSTHVLDSLHDLGVRVVIDDFGSGFSSLGYLVDLPLDGFKVDRQFIAALPTRASARSILRSLIHLADDNNLSLVAEGVQCVEEDQWVRSLGSPMVQGFYYGRPQSSDECGDLRSLSAWPSTRGGGQTLETRRLSAGFPL